MDIKQRITEIFNIYVVAYESEIVDKDFAISEILKLIEDNYVRKPIRTKDHCSCPNEDAYYLTVDHKLKCGACGKKG